MRVVHIRRLALVNPHVVVLYLNSVLAAFPHTANGPTRLEEHPGFCVGGARPASFRTLRPSTTTTISFPASENFTSTFFIVMRSLHTLIAKLDAGWEKAKRSPGDGGTSRGFSGSFWGNLAMGGGRSPITVI